MTDLPLEFPIIVFRQLPSHGDRPAREVFAWYDDPDFFTRGSPKEIGWKMLKGALLVDATGMSWRVLDMFDAGRRANLLLSLGIAFWQGDHHRIGYELEEEGRIPFESVRERVCASISSSPFIWCDQKLLADKGPWSPEARAMLDAKAAKVRQATSMRELIAALDAMR
ncbi:hypothetical protein [Arenibaculum pallidiluteum]|uniref:hypothetical protein n=1 Tax=Arenibaculum pallidiluteum TaxID=2812559 RepID=UPI001A970306|nr:hypothetical protein [Arenibaculum pallidiluteum]